MNTNLTGFRDQYSIEVIILESGVVQSYRLVAVIVHVPILRQLAI